MRKKLIFPRVDYNGLPRDNYITISKNKIVDYYGVYPIYSKDSVRTTGELYLNNKYSLTKIDKYDRLSYNVKGTHIIDSEMLEECVHAPCFIDLNFFERIYVNWYLRKYIIQDLGFKKNIISVVIGIIVGAIINEIFS